ncbi:putative component of membrane protein insertase Oxa1/YidC/SpoIIIJ protein YidD [Streptosporangium becharense]|uniref:Putative component of membrane protein insertase Oxa1/YidC/SpoIIIJ protein YidD n=1 Tax=Streptosporangium becharense TaxID=1816182 RepID=A0A7W9MGW3_9ACTN|nr:hypothetical protein [Streptosporangium becharense]MBB2914889.1 putative component of membrane protein insertase Oxa1/YidC/SpoIIIJ protein YidD [Streptosporangium becharense]MBB5820300.1 putative component of membrane protein insertase Oxa1/YidC/SpoIIIJ protein YidD [Streptosporangium becharense]
MIFHRCRFAPTAVQHVATSLIVTGPGATLVLQRCARCGRHQVETLPGRWDAQQLDAGTRRPS